MFNFVNSFYKPNFEPGKAKGSFMKQEMQGKG